MLTRDSDVLKLSLIKQCRIEWIINFIPGRYVADGLAVLVRPAAFEIAKITDVVRRPVTTRPRQAFLPGFGQQRLFLKQDIEGYQASVFSFSPHAEMPRKALAQLIGCF